MSENPPPEPLAVVGMACRLPGADDLDGFWTMLVHGREAIGPGPEGREDRRAGGYVGGVDRFDAGFFAVSAHEAAAMDPQQRLLLELTWHALEDARTAPDSLKSTPTGVFVGSCADDHALVTRMSGNIDAYTMTGVGRAFLANRISYCFGFTGPSLVVDTGQSSSLAALHQAALSLRGGECETAVVAGVQLNLTAMGDRVVEELGAMSPSGKCHTFDSRADGIVRGEGAGVVVLKRLADAVAAGDRVYCTLLASAVGNDGGGPGLTTPSRSAQRNLLAEACRRAGVAPSDVAYVELHGTGTRAGDPVEARALGAVFGRGRSSGDPLLVGSVKTNIGHLEGGAGLAGLIKTALSLYHRELPPTLNHVSPNPAIDLDGLRLEVCTERRPWPEREGPLLAGVSSFGLGGTNCHAVLGEAPAFDAVEADPAGHSLPVLLSGHSEAALREQSARLAERVERAGRTDLAAVGLASATTRTAMRHRAAVVASDEEQLVARLRALADGTPAEAVEGVVAGAAGGGRTAFLFPGQGMQRFGMGRVLHKEFGVFARAFDEAAAAVEPLLGLSIRDALWERPELVDRMIYAQPALYALEVGLYRLFESWGLVPDLVLGHSQGEVTCAHVAGVLSVEDAAVLTYHRGRLMSTLPRGGVMIAVQAEEDEVDRILAGTDGVLGIGAINGPRSLVLSGEEAPATEVAEYFRGLGRRVRPLPIEIAAHSPLMRPIQEELGEIASGLRMHRPTGPTIVSTVTGEPVDPEAVSRPDYWPLHLQKTVRYSHAVTTAHELGARFFAEVGPGPGLSVLASESVGFGDEHFAAPLGHEDETAGVAETVGMAFLHGAKIDWPAVYGGGTRPADLPLYAFQRQRYRLDAAPPDPAAASGQAGRAWDGDPAALVVECVTAILRRPPDHRIDLAASFTDLGFDSRQAVALRTTLAKATGFGLPTTLLFDHPTPLALIEALRRAKGHVTHDR
ncbi:type I polyketide synthase [Actinocorallia populi]|uniref:type I polyketide synthase n=1 Tax=Actinocorallia populi TaxID=2079200 RepID=UPI000D08ADD4|nr:type I polyketide synthase [Actinocorallia populi]